MMFKNDPALHEKVFAGKSLRGSIGTRWLRVASLCSLSCFFLFNFARAASDPASTAGAADAEEMIFFEEIPSVYSASKYEQKVTKAPSSVSIVTAEEIKRFGYRTLADVLSGQKGFYTTYDRNYHYAGVRGFGRPGDYNSRFLVQVNGFRMNDEAYGAAAIGTDFPVDIDLIERIEIVRGPSSSIYGTNAFFGVVNVITRTGRGLSGVEVSGEGASFDTFAGRASYGDRFGEGVDVFASASVFDSGGQNLFFPEFSDVNGGVTEGNDYDRNHRFFGSVAFGNFTFQGFHASRRKGIPTAPWGTVFGEDNYTIDGQRQFGVDYDRVFGDGLNFNVRFAYDHYFYEGEYIYDWAEEEGDPPDLVPNYDYVSAKRWSTEASVSKNLWTRHNLILGTEYRNIFEIEQFNEDPGYEVYLDDRRSSDVFGLYLQDEFTILKNLSLTGGLRYDYYSFEEGWSRTSPRLALIWGPAERTSLKFIYGEAFRAATAYELFYHDGDLTQKAAGSLKPETVRTGEAIVEHYFNDN